MARTFLTADQVDQFEEQGVLVLRDQVPEATRRSLEAAFHRAIDRIAAQRGVTGAVTGSTLDERYHSMRAADDRPIIGAWRRVLLGPEIYALWQLPELLGPARRLLGDAVLAHGIWNGRPRQPGAPGQRVSWHQDAHYYRGWDPADGWLLSMWTPLVPVDESSSCLEFVPGSHRRGWIDRCRDAHGGFTVDERELDGVETFVAEMEPGDLVLFTDTTLHQSTANLSDHIRWSVDIRYAPDTPALAAKNPRGYRIGAESYQTWAARYDYASEDLVDELENFAGLDLDAIRDALRREAELPFY